MLRNGDLTGKDADVRNWEMEEFVDKEDKARNESEDETWTRPIHCGKFVGSWPRQRSAPGDLALDCRHIDPGTHRCAGACDAAKKMSPGNTREAPRQFNTWAFGLGWPWMALELAMFRCFVVSLSLRLQGLQGLQGSP